MSYIVFADGGWAASWEAATFSSAMKVGARPASAAEAAIMERIVWNADDPGEKESLKAMLRPA